MTANQNPDFDTILFAVPTNGVVTIAPASELPAIIHSVFIDGYSQSNAAPNSLPESNNAVLKVVLDGVNAGPVADGLVIQASGCTVRGLAIGRFNGNGILISGGHSNVIAGNFLGTDPTGLSPRGNGRNGVWVDFGDGNVIGGAAPASRNVLCANLNYGVEIYDGVGNSVRGNFIGIRADGRTPLANGFGGLAIDGGTANVIGGSETGHGNVISGNSSTIAVQISASGNVVQGNIIGLDAMKSVVLSNTLHGVTLDGSNNLLGAGSGGFPAAGANWIAGHISHGVVVLGDDSRGNGALGNRIFRNRGLAIDLGGGGVTDNDLDDSDSGPNGLQNFPVLSAAHVRPPVHSGGYVTGMLTSAPSSTYRLEFFISDAPDPAGFGEGEVFLGQTNVTTDAAGRAQFVFTSDIPLSVGDFLTATATDAANNTSEFSRTVEVATNNTPTISVNGVMVLGSSLNVTNRALIEMQSPFAEGALHYNLNARDDRLYSGPLTVTESVLLRVTAHPSRGAPSEARELTINVWHPPVIGAGARPLDRKVLVGTTVAFSVQADGTAPLSYRWFFNGDHLLTGLNQLFITNVQPLNAGNYWVVVSNRAGTVTSSTARLDVLWAPAITSQPLSTNVNPGALVTFCLEASGVPVRYQWRHNGVNIDGATNHCLQISPVEIADGGSYTVVVANDVDAVTSQPALLIVNVPLRGAGDNFAHRQLMTGPTGSLRATNVSFTKEAGEMDHGGKPGGASGWYEWQAPAHGIVTLNTAGSGFDTLLAVYTGTALENLVPVAGDDDTGEFLTSKARFNVIGGAHYVIALDGYAGSQGNYVLNWSFTATNPAPVITAPPAGRTVGPGEPTVFSVSATGAGLRYQWFFNGAPIAGAVNASLPIATVLPAHVGFYHVRITDHASQFTQSTPVALEIGPEPLFQSRDKYEELLLENPSAPEASFHSLNSPMAAMASAGFISVAPGMRTNQVINNQNSLFSPGEPNHCARIGKATRWLVLKPQTSGTLIVDTEGSAIPTVSAIYRQGPNLTLVQLGCAVDPTGRLHPSIRLEAKPNVAYLIVTDGYEGALGLIRLNWRFGHPPQSVPVSSNDVAMVGYCEAVTVHPPANLTNTIPPSSFQWLLNGVPVLQATNSSLSIDCYLPWMAGDYSVMVSNFVGSVTNYIKTLPVLSPPLTAARMSPTSFQFLFRGQISNTCSIEASSDLKHWSTVKVLAHDHPLLTSPESLVEDTNAWAQAYRFYRAVMRPP